MNYLVDGLKKTFQYSGRASRKEYWMYVLFQAIILIALSIIDAFISGGIIYTVVALLACLPSIAISVRRMHDINKSGFWVLISLIPLVGGIWLLVLLCKAGIEEENNFDGAVLE